MTGTGKQSTAAVPDCLRNSTPVISSCWSAGSKQNDRVIEHESKYLLYIRMGRKALRFGLFTQAHVLEWESLKRCCLKLAEKHGKQGGWSALTWSHETPSTASTRKWHANYLFMVTGLSYFVQQRIAGQRYVWDASIEQIILDILQYQWRKLKSKSMLHLPNFRPSFSLKGESR